MRLFLLALPLLAACAAPRPEAAADPAPRPALTHAADSLAWEIIEASGGTAAWDALPALRFDFAFARDGAEVFRRHHLWDKATGRYRVEWSDSPDSLYVALFSVDGFDVAAPAGSVTMNGQPLGSAFGGEQLRSAYEMFVNDTYWLLAPLKLFDPGVRRAPAPDSARAGERVLTLSFEDVGLTPGDRYWLFADASGRLARWTYRLEGGQEATYLWEDYTTLPTPRGPLRLATRKRRLGTDRAILTPVFPTDSLPADAFTRPTPLL